MRVIAGEFRGRILKSPAGRRIRPTQGQVRRVLFDMIGNSIAGTRVLDLFAGSGALGIEALSRGALEVCFVERNEAALRCLRANLEALDLAGRTRVLAASVAVGLRTLAESDGPYEWVFSDPPYESKPDEWIRQAERCGPGGILATGGTLVVERSRRQACSEQMGRLRRGRVRTIGETNLEFFGWEETNNEEKGDLRGTFDPVTLGHLDITERALHLFDHLTVAVACTERHHKKTLFSLEERIEMFQDVLPDEFSGRVEVAPLNGLLVDFARERGVEVVVRGLRFFSDFEYELQMATMNQRLWPDLDTLFLMPNEKYSYVNSSLVKEIARNGGQLKGLVHPAIGRRLRARYAEMARKK